MAPKKVTVKAPAKINLHLAVKNVRPDGFHDLESIFLPLDFADTLHFKPLKREGDLKITMRWRGIEAPPSLPMEDNIIFKAVTLFRRETGFSQGLRVSVEKRIPLGAGLGGGSSDAAATLLAMNHLAGGALDPVKVLDFIELAELGAALGSDVPFFLHKCARNCAAWVSGRGEHITPITVPRVFWVVLVNPGFSSGTREAFRLLDQFRAGTPVPAAVPGIVPGINLAQPPEEWPFFNDFLTVFLQSSDCKTVYREILDSLGKTGACFSGLSGSGSTCFGIFPNRKTAIKAKKSLKKTWKVTKVTFSLALSDIERYN